MNIVLRNSVNEGAMVPFYPWSLLDEADAFYQNLWNTWKPFRLDGNLTPVADIYEEKDQLVVKIELAGIEQKDLDISLEGDQLSIKAEKKEEIKEGITHHARERFYGKYERSLTLPYAVKAEAISATFTNGVLELRLPKAEEAKVRKIEIKHLTSEVKPVAPENAAP